MILLMLLIIVLLSYVFLICSYYNITNYITDLHKTFIMKYIYRLINCNKILFHLINDINPIVYLFTIGISLFALIFILIF